MPDYTIGAVDEALALLLQVAQNPGLGVTELAARSGNTKARTFRLLYTLEQRNFVVKRGSGTAYYMDTKALYLGVAAREQVLLTQAARTPLLALGREVNENVQLRVRDGLECICIDNWNSNHPGQVRSHAGSRRKLHAGASCKLLLAHAPADVRQALLGDELPRYSGTTITQRSRLVQELERIRTDGYAVSDGEITPGLMALAVPVLDPAGQVVAALSVSGPPARLQPRVQTLVELARAHAAQVSQAMAALISEGAPAPSLPRSATRAV